MTPHETAVMTGQIPSAVPKIPLRKRGEVLITTADSMALYAKSKGFTKRMHGDNWTRYNGQVLDYAIYSMSDIAQMFIYDTKSKRP